MTAPTAPQSAPLPCLASPLDWHADAAAERTEAASLCVGCPAITKCLDGAIQRGEQYGVWGGQDFGARRVPKVAACGTESGYRRHNRLREPQCIACLVAKAKAVRDRKARATREETATA